MERFDYGTKKEYIYKITWVEKTDTGHVLELKGARQVGKIYILKKFGKENFSKMIYIRWMKWIE